MFKMPQMIGIYLIIGTLTRATLFTCIIIVFSAIGANTYQIVVATNGEYTYAIIQIVSVIQGRVRPTYILDQSDVVVKILPYADDIDNAPNDSNSGVPGTYIVDLNSK